MIRVCPNCEKESAKREPDEPRSMERYVCTLCDHEFFVHCHYLIDIPESAPIHFYVCHYVSPGGVEGAKARIQLKRLLAKYESWHSGNLEEQYASGANVWVLGTFREPDYMKLSAEAAVLGLVIEATRDVGT